MIYDKIPISYNTKTQSSLLGFKATISFPLGSVRDFDIEIIVDQILLGKIPRFSEDAMGKLNLEFDSCSESGGVDKCGFFIQYESMICSYLGQYGAGKTINTFSLLPNEKTTISVRTYRDSVSSINNASNFIDSINQASVNSFEKSLQKQNGKQKDQSENGGFSFTSTKEEGSGLLAAIFANRSSSSTMSLSSTQQGMQSEIKSVVSNAVSSNVNESNYHRDIPVNTTTSNTVSSGEETTIVRELENVNQSRTLNFVFRELLQEYITIHWLKNIKFGFYNDKTQEVQRVFSHNLFDLLNTLIKPEHVNEVFGMLMGPVRMVMNYDENFINFFEPQQFLPTPIQMYVVVLSSLAR
ncbi:MAG: hypothetical protein IPK03_00425 [Bacteroidetes bacterium]|nr:hypothetical protein [Bacteroidota bacterium]